jgi:hypothetical protein
MLKAMPFALLLAAGCGSSGLPNNADETASPAPSTPVDNVAAPKAQPMKVDEESDLLEFHLAWPAEVSAIPVLAGKLRASATAHKAELLKMAAEDKAQREKEKFPFNGYEFSRDFDVAGNTPALLSLTENWFEFTGGAHPNHGTRAILWDKGKGGEVGVADLFEGGASKLDVLFRPAYCAALDKARAENRGPSKAAVVVGPDDPFNQCPKFADLALIPRGNAGRPMMSMTFHADPYVAGPYAEGDYDIELPVTAAVLDALKPQYRSSFEAR